MFYINYENKMLNYETFEGRLIDASFIHTSKGQIIGQYLVENQGVVVSVFYQDWSFGGKQRVLLESSVVGETGFCPKQIVSSSGWQQNFTVLSNCGDVVELVKFGFEFDSQEKDGLLSVNDIVVEEKRDVARNIKNANACQMKDELVIFDIDKQKLYSVDVDNWNKEEIDLSIFGISMLYFRCVDFGQKAFILSSLGKFAYEIVVLQSGKQHDIYNRIKSRIPIPLESVRYFTVYKVGLGFVFGSADGDNNYVYQKYIEIDSRLRTVVSSNAEAGEYTA